MGTVPYSTTSKVRMSPKDLGRTYMQAVAFDDSLRTGHAVIDGQHEGLFRLAARVADKIGTCSIVDASSDTLDCATAVNDAVADAVFGLIDYATEHFADEEALMRQAHFPMAELHASLHHELAQQLAAMAASYLSGEDALAPERLVDFFTEWLTGHIMQSDRRFVDWLVNPSSL